ncbi:MAG: FAD-dependent monooxygenase [Candidatus Binatia bacterium]|nr:FAD-dependent monooxygenase [Candidatus Binatia bacterium]
MNRAADQIKKVIIAGAGVGGLSAAVALHRRGIEVEVYEKHLGPQKHTTGFTLWSYAIARLDELGIGADAMKSIGSPVETTEIRNQKGRLISKMPVGEVSRKLGHASYEIRRPRLLEALEACLPAGTVRRGVECLSAKSTQHGAVIELPDGAMASGDLVIGADGIRSNLRQCVSGATELRDSGYRGCSAVANFSSESLPPNVHIDVWGRGGKAGIAEVGEGRARWYLTWKTKLDAKRQTRAQLSEFYADWDPILGSVIEATDESDIIHHEFFDIPPIKTWRLGRVILLGDAAHATTPFAAMGANMTIEDVAVLMDQFEQRDSTEAALSGFEEARKKRTEEIVKKGKSMARLTQLHSSFAAWLRDQAFLHMPPEEVEKVTEAMASGD